MLDRARAVRHLHCSNRRLKEDTTRIRSTYTDTSRITYFDRREGGTG